MGAGQDGLSCAGRESWGGHGIVLILFGPGPAGTRPVASWYV